MTRFRSRLVSKLSAFILAILILLSVSLVYMQVENTKKASEEAIGYFSIHTAEAYAGQFDLQAYENFLQDAQENELYWSLREEINRYRVQIGALYVYTVKIDEQKQPLLLIDGQPRDSDAASPIGEVTDMPQEAIDAILDGRSAKTGIIRNPEYGNYISSFAPLRSESGEVIGAIGIDTDVSVSQTIYREVIGENTLLFVLTGVLTIVFFVLIVLFLSRALRPLGAIVRGAEAMARGNLAEAKAQLGAGRSSPNDEIGQAYSAMMQMIERLGVTLGEVLKDIALTARDLVHSTERFGSEAERMVAMNVELERAAAQLADGAINQRIGTAQSAKSMEDITVAIQKASEASASVSGASGEALDFAEEGTASIGRLREQVLAMADVAMQTTRSVDILNSHMDEIEPVLRSITDIADQTKLLALNASIEAARAGEHGAGFAIVAGEVRKLAEASAVSVERITSLLYQVKQESGQIDERMQLGNEGMKLGSELSDRAETLFRLTMGRFGHVNGQIQEVSAVIEEVLAGSEEVAASVEQISQISARTAESTEAIERMSAQQLEAAKLIADTTEMLRERGARLEAGVAKFKL
ncbi:methyl-accepting chemotaxis protein [Cohnella cellulosilytica]|uniref:Methyl-accepting chemotaxis protein n=1 Tax=Cohnella cellulosilytica TaxID=986710 RepID=A0ABW2F7Y5_9BACL